jgi:hypothetical protein
VRLATEDVLEGGTVWIPEASILQSRCPSCAASVWARLGDGQVAVGAAKRDPALFQPAMTAADPQLSLRPEAGWLDCWHEGRYRRFPARPFISP